MTIQHLARPLAIKALGENGVFTGYASVFGNVDSYNEIVEPGAFAKTLAAWRAKNSAPAMLWMHDPTMPIGVWMTMSEDQNGLIVQGRVALSTQKGREAYELMKMKALTGLSIGYRVVSSKIDSKKKIRVLTEVDLFEVSLVTFPANDKARVRDVKAPRVTTAAQKRSGGIDRKRTQAAVAPLHRAARTLRQGSQAKTSQTTRRS